MIEGSSSRHDEDFPDPIGMVWQALTNGDDLSAWLMSTDDFRPVVGQRFTMFCEPEGVIRCEVLEVEPPRRMVWAWHGRFGVTTVVFELTETAGGTHLRLDHSGWDHLEDAQRFDNGWPGKLTALRSALVSNRT
jgi:uncharacterized protein YndB with AHSA1/START domain